MTASADPIDPSDPQSDAVAFLEAEGTLQARERARRVDTHAARIFLAGNRAWKLKRAVHLDYLDFSSADRRRDALETELRLNRRTAPGLYIAVHPLCRAPDGTLKIDGDGEPIDWLLEMHRFPDDALLEQVAARGGLDEALVTRLADRIKTFHNSAAECPAPSGHRRIETVIAGNGASMARFPEIFAPPIVQSLIERQRESAARHAALLDSRGREGRIRHGHGDLHLANIAVIDGEPLLFDCLEFDADLATTDVLYDLGFLLMDMWARGFRSQANAMFNRYLDLSPQDEAGIALLPLFLSIRATIRAHALAAQAAGVPAGSEIVRKAKGYLACAADLLAPVPPRLAAVGGLSGTGKSTIAKRIGATVGRSPGARILRSDVLRKRLAGVPPECALRKDAYTRDASARVYGEMERLARQALQAGQAVIADAVFADPEERRSIARLAAQCGVPFDGIWLEAPMALLEARIGARTNDASDADAAVARLQAGYDIGDLGSWHRVNAAGRRDEIAARVQAALAGP